MFSLSTYFRTSRNPEVPGHVLYQISEGRHVVTIPTGIYSSDKEIIYRKKSEISFGLKSIYCVIEELGQNHDTVDLRQIADKSTQILNGRNPYAGRIMEQGSRFPVNPEIATISPVFKEDYIIVRPVSNAPDADTLLGYIDKLYVEYRNRGKGSAHSYRNTSLSLQRFTEGKDMPIESVDNEFIMGYNSYLSSQVSPATRAFYLRVLRSTLNHAQKEGYTVAKITWPEKIDRSPTATSGDPILKSLGPAVLREIADLDLAADKEMEFVRDLFMFCFYAHGIEMIDLANLKWSDLKDDCLSYHRRQRGRLIEVRLGEKALDIIRRHHEPSGEYLFPLLYAGGRPYSFDKVRADIRKGMLAIGQMLREPVKLTFGMSRNSWINLPRSTNIAEQIL